MITYDIGVDTLVHVWSSCNIKLLKMKVGMIQLNRLEEQETLIMLLILEIRVLRDSSLITERGLHN